MLAGLVGAIALSAILKYKVVVKAPVIIRPSGELRLVQANAEGAIQKISVTVNQTVQAGDVIAYIDDSRLQTKKNQLQSDIASNKNQLSQIHAQLENIDREIVAQSNQLQRSVASAQAELNLNQRTYSNSRATTEADLQEMEASLAFAQNELKRYQQLASTGAVSEVQIQEKVAAVNIARARLKKAQAALNPSDASVDKSRQMIAQEQARRDAEVARLSQERERLIQEQKEVENKLNGAQQDLRQTETELKNTVIRAPIAGTILELKLRNISQVVSLGEELARIAPSGKNLIVKALVNSQDISKVEVGQSAEVRVSACPYPDFGTLSGKVQAVAPDAIAPESSPKSPFSQPTLVPSQRNFEVTIQPSSLLMKTDHQNCQLQAGMEGSVDIISKQESVLQFVLRKARLLLNT